MGPDDTDRASRRLSRMMRIAAMSMLSLAIAVAAAACNPADGRSQITSADDRLLGRQELQDLSDFEPEVLADKQVSEAELGQARTVLVQCFGRQGIQAIQSDAANPGPSTIVAQFDVVSAAEADRLEAAERDCRAEVSAAEEVWVLQHELNEDQQRLAKGDIRPLCSTRGR